MITVSKNNGDFTTLQEAVLSVDDHASEPVTILIEPGIYEEKVFIRKKNIHIIGKNRDNTIFLYGDGAKKLRPDGTDYGTFNTAVVFFAGSDITVENITFKNTAGSGKTAGQALAVYIGSDRTAFYNCAFLGHQDTVFTGNMSDEPNKRLMLPDFFQKSDVKIQYDGNRNYFEDCYICGDVDYIFGPSTAYFNRCQIYSKLLTSESVSYITAASTPNGQEHGYVFSQCDIAGEGENGSIYLGRPWRDYAKTAFIQCTMDKRIHPVGWHNWNRPKAEVTSTYLEYANTGEGACTAQRAPFSKQLTNPGILAYYSPESVLSGDDGWKPWLYTPAATELPRG